MKRLMSSFVLSVGIAWSLPVFGLAQGSFIPALMYEVGIASITTNVIAVSTSAATRVDTPALAGRVSVEMQNIDTSASLWCGPVSGNASANSGRKITAGSSWILNLSDTNKKPGGEQAFSIYCLSDGTATTKAAVTQLY